MERMRLRDVGRAPIGALILSLGVGAGVWTGIAAVSPFLHPWSDPMFWPAMLTASFVIGSVVDLRPYMIGSLLVAAGPLSTAGRVVVVMRDPALIPVALLTVALFALVLSLSAFAGRFLRRRIRSGPAERSARAARPAPESSP